MQPLDSPADPTAGQDAPQGLRSSEGAAYRRRPPFASGARAEPAPALKKGAPGAKGAMKRTRITRLPAAGREEQLARWGLEDRPPVRLRPSWGEEPGDDNAFAPHQGAASRTGLAPEDVDFLRTGGWRIASIDGGDEEGGITSHRGVLHPDEYVNKGVLRKAVEAELGFTYDEVHSVYRQGRLSTSQGELRAQIDARLLALSRAEGNVLALARVLSFRVRTNRPGGGDDCPVFDSALARARSTEPTPKGGKS